jgi:D-hexose-6-phosphate mutarotase
MVNPLPLRAGPGGLTFLDVANAAAEASVCVQGAQLVHWQPRAAAHPATFLAAAVQYVPGRSLRGGIPVCWPWFGPHPTEPSKPSHGFVRNLRWTPQPPQPLADGETRLVLTLTDSEETRRLWPWAFLLECRFTIGAELRVELLTTNTGDAPFVVTEALHTYFLVSDVAAVTVTGLEGAGYVDKVAGGAHRQQVGPVHFAGEVDRVYTGSTADCVIVDPGLRRRIHIGKEGSRSTVVWNPGVQRAAQLADLGATDDPAGRGGWRQLVCVESANALDDPVSVAPGATHRLAVRYRIDPL